MYSQKRKQKIEKGFQLMCSIVQNCMQNSSVAEYCTRLSSYRTRSYNHGTCILQKNIAQLLNTAKTTEKQCLAMERSVQQPGNSTLELWKIEKLYKKNVEAQKERVLQHLYNSLTVLHVCIMFYTIPGILFCVAWKKNCKFWEALKMTNHSYEVLAPNCNQKWASITQRGV